MFVAMWQCCEPGVATRHGGAVDSPASAVISDIERKSTTST